ncbi:hypothetical protein DFH11DRAFT_1515630 [Phellopilus nigrolimitatus]|nr:hypothetical protein DFH11DRAFT_1515630 [Phellopilus nigrolimitatus]
MHQTHSDIESLDLRLVPLLVSEIDISMYGQVAILTLLVYDTIITMDKEIKFFWVCYIPTSPFYTCYAKYSSPLIVYADILLMRVLALYHQDKKLAACLRTLFGLEAALGLSVLIYTIIYAEISVGRLAEGVSVCLFNRSPNIWGAIVWAVPVLYAIILMVLALLKAAQHWRELAGFSQFNLLKVLIKDQAIYFICVILCNIMVIVSFQLNAQHFSLASLLSVLGYPRLLSVLGNHLLVHLKEAGERGANGGTSYRMTTMSSMRFS